MRKVMAIAVLLLLIGGAAYLYYVRGVYRQPPKLGAECPNRARSDLCGGRSAMSVPTAIVERFNQPRQREEGQKFR